MSTCTFFEGACQRRRAARVTRISRDWIRSKMGGGKVCLRTWACPGERFRLAKTTRIKRDWMRSKMGGGNGFQRVEGAGTWRAGAMTVRMTRVK